MLAGGFVLSLPALWSAAGLWLRLPVVQASRVDPDEVQAAFDRSRRRTSAEAREAFALRLASSTLTGALTGKVEPGQLQTTIADAVRTLSRSRVGRLQQAAARMWVLEQRGEPIENWWPTLRVFLEGMQRANLRHYQATLVQDWTRAYELVQFGPGTAYSLAEDLVGHRHGPFLQFFTTRLRRVIAERELAGDSAAVGTCRGVLYRLLRQWVLEPGPAGLRLLAAELLAENLNDDAAAIRATDEGALAGDLRAWRAACLEAARRRPIGLLDPHRKPTLAAQADERLLARVALTTWLAAATLTAAVMGIVLAWAWIRRGGPVVRAGGLLMRSLIVACVVLVGGSAWIWLWPDSVRGDLRGDFSRFQYWWRHPFLAAALTLALVLAAALLQRAPEGRESRLVARLGAIAAGTWLMLALTLWGSAIADEIARRGYERDTRAAYEDSVGAMAGADAEGLLTRLRRWESWAP